MKYLIFSIVFISILGLSGCGSPEKDARMVCGCYHEVTLMDDEKEMAEKLKECLKMLEDFKEKHKKANTYEAFENELNICR